VHAVLFQVEQIWTVAPESASTGSMAPGSGADWFTV
jgi:hypothetical protein